MNRGKGRAIQRRTSRAIESHLQTVGWISRQKISRLPAEGEAFLLTSLFIEPPISRETNRAHQSRDRPSLKSRTHLLYSWVQLGCGMRAKLIFATLVALLFCSLATLEITELFELTDDTFND